MPALAPSRSGRSPLARCCRGRCWRPGPASPGHPETTSAFSPGSAPVSRASLTPWCSARRPSSRSVLVKTSRRGFVLRRRDRARTRQDDGRAQLVGHGKGGIGPAHSLVELIGRVERPSRWQRQRRRATSRPSSRCGAARAGRSRPGDAVRHRRSPRPPRRGHPAAPPRGSGRARSGRGRVVVLADGGSSWAPWRGTR